MHTFIVLVLSSLVVVVVNAADTTNILCTASFCTEYLLENTCPDLSANCLIQNETHSGIFLPYAGPCQCCDYCVTNLAEGDSCAIGDAASPVPRVICGDLLSCVEGEDDNTCHGIETDCTDAQGDYDDQRDTGNLGHLQIRPSCQRRGLYDPHVCIPGEICYCVDEDGNRIFGDMPFTTLAPAIMACECSRKYQKAVEYLQVDKLYSSQFLRCKSNGDYDPIQCIDDNCFCVHTQDGTPAINIFVSVNVTSISNETMPCFDDKIHIEGEYYRECEEKVIEILAEIEDYEAMGLEVIGYSFPNCQLDGYYAAVQVNSTHKYCSGRNGDVLEGFIVSIDDRLAEDMNCNCARSRNTSITDKPQCCDNGNYNPMQCRRGLCRCVDENGNQYVQEKNFVDRASLPCYQTGCAEIIVDEEEDEEGNEEENEEGDEEGDEEVDEEE